MSSKFRHVKFTGFSIVINIYFWVLWDYVVYNAYF